MEWDKKAVSNTPKPPRKAVEAESVILTDNQFPSGSMDLSVRPFLLQNMVSSAVPSMPLKILKLVLSCQRCLLSSKHFLLGLGCTQEFNYCLSLLFGQA